MPTDRELIEIFTIAHMAGIEEAQKGLLSMNAVTLALAAALGVLMVVGKAGIENYKAQEEALNLLNQAATTQGDNLAYVRQITEEFIATNAKYIKNQYDVIQAMAMLVRAGNSEIDSIRILNDALDLSTIKHEDVSVAAATLIKVLAGNSRALRELGISTEEYNQIMKSKTLTLEEKHAALLALIEQRTAKGRETTDQLVQSQNSLTISWQNFTSKTGPALLQTWEKLNEAMATALDLLTLFYELNEKLFGSHGVVTGAFNAPAGASPFGGRGVHGGSQTPTIIHNWHISGVVNDGPALDHFTNEIVRRLAMAPGT